MFWLLAKTEPRQLKSLGTDAFIASGSFLNRMYCDKGVRSRQKKLVANLVAILNLSFTALFYILITRESNDGSEIRESHEDKTKCTL